MPDIAETTVESTVTCEVCGAGAEHGCVCPALPARLVDLYPDDEVEEVRAYHPGHPSNYGDR